MADMDAWRDFTGPGWREAVDVAGFIRHNRKPYTGDSDFLSGPTLRTTAVWSALRELFPVERESAASTTLTPAPPRPSPRTGRATSTGNAS